MPTQIKRSDSRLGRNGRSTCNVGPRERYVRFGLATLAGAAALSPRRSRATRSILAGFAAAETITAVTRYCPLSALLGIDNCHDSRDRSLGHQHEPTALELNRSAHVDGIAMRWEEHGRGDDLPVVFIHGIPTNPRLWRYVIPRLQHARCLAWEMVGFGRSIPAGRGRDISVAAQAEYLRLWLDHLGIEHAVLVGHDLGGGAVQRFAVTHPDRVLGLVLTDCIAYDNWPVAPVRAARLAARAGLIDRLPAALLKPLLLSSLMYLGHDSPRRRQSAAAHWRPYARDDGPEGFARQLRHLDTRDTLEVAPLLPELGRRGLPAYVLWGDRDPLGLASGKRLARDLGADFQRLPGARHFTPEDHPEEIAAAIQKILIRVRAAGQRSAFPGFGLVPTA